MCIRRQGRSQEGGGAWLLGLRPKPRGGSPPAVRSCGEAAGVWGGAPAGVWGRSPQYFALAAKPPRGLGRSPKSHGPPGPPLLATALTVVSE